MIFVLLMDGQNGHRTLNHNKRNSSEGIQLITAACVIHILYYFKSYVDQQFSSKFPWNLSLFLEFLSNQHPQIAIGNNHDNYMVCTFSALFILFSCCCCCYCSQQSTNHRYNQSIILLMFLFF